MSRDTPEDEGLIIHVLFHGLPLCLFSRDVPAMWPKHHRWVGLHDWIHANCLKCKAEAAAAKARKSG